MAPSQVATEEQQIHDTVSWFSGSFNSMTQWKVDLLFDL